MKNKKNILIITAILLIGIFGALLFTILADNEETDSNPVLEEQVSEVENENEISFSNSVKEIFIGYKHEEGSGEIVSLNKDTLPTEAITYAIHNGLPYIYISFADDLSEEQVSELLKQVNVEGDENISFKISQNYNQYLVDIKNLKDYTTVTLGDIKPITIKRMEPLEFSVMNKDNSILFIEVDEAAILLVSEEMESITLTFSEEMKQDNSISFEGKKFGNWIDKYNYNIDLTALPLDAHIAGVFNQLLSVNGNYIMHSEKPLIISRKPDYSWIDYKTGEKIGWEEPYLRYYERILFSPDKNLYIGIIEHTEYLFYEVIMPYTFVVHENGKEPYLLEDIYYSNDSFMGYPIQWINNEEIIYDNNLFNIRTKKTKEVYQLDEEYIGEVHDSAYDFVDNKLYFLMLKDAGSEEYIVDKWTFNNVAEQPTVEQHYSDVRIISNNFAKLPIKIVDNGIYWSKHTDNNSQVIYEGRDGSTENREGSILFANNKGAVIYDSAAQVYFWWEIGKKDIVIPFIDYIQPFGNDIVYYNGKEKQYYCYEPSENDWVKLDFPEGAYLPNQEINQLYRK